MNGFPKAFTFFCLIASAMGGPYPEQLSAEVTSATNEAGQHPQVTPRAIVPTSAGQIGINPPPTQDIKGSIGPYSKFLFVQDPNLHNGGYIHYQWHGPNPSYATVFTTTTTEKPSSTVVATVTKGVLATKNEDGGLDILLSPAVKAKLESIAKQVTPCSSKKRSTQFLRRGGPACGLEDFVNRVGDDVELRETFLEPLTEDVFEEETDSGYGSGEEGEGGGDVPLEDEGYSSDLDGFSPDPENSEILETIVFSSDAEAAAIAAEAAVVDATLFGSETITAATFLGMIWNAVTSKDGLEPVYDIPKESIHTITKTKTKTKSTATETSTTSTSSCPTGDPYPTCGFDCIPTSTKPSKPGPTDMVEWACSKGKDKDCRCNPAEKQSVDTYPRGYAQAILDALHDIEKSPPKPSTTCPLPVSQAPSRWFGDITKKFCPEAMKSKSEAYGPFVYDIYGNKVTDSKPAGLQRRSPPDLQVYYKDYKFSLKYEPKDGQCLSGNGNSDTSVCTDAYDKLVKSNCGTNPGIVSNRLFVDAKIDVGCGVFSWHVESPEKPKPAPSTSSAPTAEPTVGPITNYPDSQCPSQDVDPKKVQDNVDSFCEKYSGEVLSKDDNDKVLVSDKPSGYGQGFGDVTAYPKWYNITTTWIEGCDMAPQKIDEPLPGKSCSDIFNGCYKDAVGNQGRGGYRTVGCLYASLHVQCTDN